MRVYSLASYVLAAVIALDVSSAFVIPTPKAWEPATARHVASNPEETPEPSADPVGDYRRNTKSLGSSDGDVSDCILLSLKNCLVCR